MAGESCRQSRLASRNGCDRTVPPPKRLTSRIDDVRSQGTRKQIRSQRGDDPLGVLFPYCHNLPPLRRSPHSYGGVTVSVRALGVLAAPPAPRPVTVTA